MPDASVRRDDLGDAMSKPVPAPVDGWTFARDVDGRLSARATSAYVAILNDDLCVGVFNYESDADIPLSVICALLADATPVDWMDPIAAEESARRLVEEVKRADANETWANHWRGLYEAEVAKATPLTVGAALAVTHVVEYRYGVNGTPETWWQARGRLGRRWRDDKLGGPGWSLWASMSLVDDERDRPCRLVPLADADAPPESRGPL